MVSYKRRKRSTLAQEFLTRVPLTLESNAYPPSPAWLYTALLGNGRILACLDETGEVRQLFYPHIDAGPHLRSLFTGLQAKSISSGDELRTPEGNNVCWFADEAWEHRLEYIERTALVKVTSQRSPAGIHVERTLAVHPQQDILIIEVKISNLRQAPLHCRLVTYAGFDFDQRPTKNCCFFSHEIPALTFFASDRYIQLTGDIPVENFDCGQLSHLNPNLLLERIEDCEWSGNEYAIGQISGAVRHDLGIVAAHGSITRRLYLCFGRSLDEVNALSAQARLKQFDIETCASWWSDRYPPLELPAKQGAAARRIYERSLIVLRLLTDSQTGGIIAGPECDPSFSLCGGYGMCWPRDGAYNAYALDIAEQHEQARAFYDWALRTQETTGGWSQRYDVNGRLSPTWGLQFDETGTVVWAVCRHVQLTNDLSYGRKVFPHLLNACCYMQRSLDPTTGLAPLTKDLWEERDSLNTYACAATWGAFHEVSRLAARLEKTREASYWSHAAATLKAAIEEHLWSDRAGHFLRGLNLIVAPSPMTRDQHNQCTQEVTINGMVRFVQREDAILDISLLGLSVPFGVFSPHEPCMQATAEAIAQRLTSPIGGILRYQQDRYRGGNPWILCTLWLAWFDALANNRTRACELYTWVLEHRTELDLLAEQVDRVSGKPCWIVPLGWSHAMFLLASDALGKAI
jgi:glucoamylase